MSPDPRGSSVSPTIRHRRRSDLTAGEIVALGRAFFELSLAAARFRMWPAQKIIADLRERRCAGKDGGEDLQRIAWAIPAVARRLPWRSDCLIQVMAAQAWLRRSGREGDFSIGVARNDKGKFVAHAWLKVGDTIVAGGDVSRFSVLL